jgi:hypothetical protein
VNLNSTIPERNTNSPQCIDLIKSVKCIFRGKPANYLKLNIKELILRTVYDFLILKVTHKLADYGFTLVPLITELINWGKQHREKIKTATLQHYNGFIILLAFPYYSKLQLHFDPIN